MFKFIIITYIIIYCLFFQAEPLTRVELVTPSLPRKYSTTELQRLNTKSGRRVSNPLPTAWKAVALPNELLPQCVGGGGFEPPKAAPTDLQSVPFDRSGIPPIF